MTKMASVDVSNGEPHVAPASLIQRQFWILHRRDPLSPAYNIPSVSLLQGDLDIDALDESLNSLTRRYRIFRSAFDIDGSGNLVQIFPEWKRTPLLINDLRSLKGGGIDEAKLNATLIQEIRQPFDLAKGPPLRSRLFQLGDRSFILAITAHHIVFDLATKELVADAISAGYKASTLKQQEPPSGEVNDYAAFAEWQRQWLKGAEAKKMEEAWRQYLQGAESLLDLPYDRCAAGGSSAKGNIVGIEFPREQTVQIRDFCRKKEITSFVFLLSAWLMTLSRWSGQTKLSVGVPLTNRRRAEFKQTTGCFVNILPLAVDLSDPLNIQELIRRVRQALLHMHRMQEIPFLHLVHLMGQEGATSANPIFQVGFTFEPPMRLRLEGIDVVPKYVHHGGSQLTLFATFWEEDEITSGVIEYDSGLFDHATVERIGDSLRVAVDEILKDPQQRLMMLSLVPAKDLDLVRDPWNATAVSFDRSASIHGLVEAQAQRTPEARAVVFNDSVLTYAQLVQRAKGLSGYLRSLGVRSDDPVGVCLERDLDLIPVLLGVLMSGGAYVPLDPKFPAERLSSMVRDSGTRVIVVSKSHHSLFEEDVGTFVDADHEAWPQSPASSSESVAVPRDSLAYIMYTSGSTGKPKGVEVPHSAVVNFLSSMKKRPGISNNDVLLALTTISFDISVLELFLPLCSGATTVIAPAEATFDGERLARLIEGVKPSVMQATPITWKLLLASGWRGNPGMKALCGGEALKEDLMRELLPRCGELWNMYGPTETTVWSTCHRCTAEQRGQSIGKPIDNTRAYILDSNFLPVPIGVWGELFLGGSGVARGYHNQPDLTSERFLDDPFTLDGGRLYRTGDKCRFHADGSIECSGRFDHQIKIRGFRIETGEVETAIGRHPSVKDVAVDARDDPAGNRRLIAWISPLEGRALDGSEIKRFLRDSLPEYMIPQLIVLLPALPLTLNRKVDKKSLLEPRGLSTAETSLRTRSENTVYEGEKEVRSAWETILGHADFSNEDRFFEAGGDSLLAIRLRDLLVSRWGIDIPVSVMFQFPTVRQQAGFFEPHKTPKTEALSEGLDRGQKQASAISGLAKKMRSVRNLK